MFESAEQVRKLQKKKSREKNNVTTMQLSKDLKNRLIAIQKVKGFEKQDEALDEVITFYEDEA